MFCNVFSAENKIGSFAFCRRQVGMCDFSFFIHFGKDLFDIHFNDEAAAQTITAHDKHFFSFCFLQSITA
ncbi:Uncharacterised protein [Klebsiella pneumoniae]|nr:Uncharacterised protein [Klebsiella pneumoniae]